MQVRVRRSPRHACTGCGACCQGAVVHLSELEIARVREQASELGIEDPVVDRRLRWEGGRCVFLQADALCRIHGRFGGEAKPLICRQFPFVLVEAEDGLRAGVDPASAGWRLHRNDGPALRPPAGVHPRSAPRSPDQAAVEAQLVGFCEQPQATLAGLLGALCGEPDCAPDLPDGFAGRWIRTLQEAPLRALLARPEVGPDHRAALLPVLDAAATWAPADPPTWPVLDAGCERMALDLVQDLLWLRLVSRIPLVQATALLTAAGAVACAWTDPAPEAFGLRLSTWARLLRAGPFWQAMVPDPAALQHLATGR